MPSMASFLHRDVPSEFQCSCTLDVAALWKDIEGLIHQQDRSVDAVIMQGSLDKNLYFN